jgi:voltage-gated potassium channel
MLIVKRTKFRHKLHSILFEADTPSGKVFDVLLIILIVLSVLAVMLETIEPLDRKYHLIFLYVEWGITIIFTIEYMLRIYSVSKPFRYIFSFYGIIDFLAILPLYLSLVFVGTQSFAIIRALRLLRIFRVFKLGQYMDQGRIIMLSMKRSIPKIAVFLYFVILMVVVFGSIMYLIEGGTNESFDSIPRTVYWAIVTLTTVGYGDIAPITPLGQFLAAIVMIMGYAVIAVPTGIISAEIIKHRDSKEITTQACHHCMKEGHDVNAKYCKHCGEKLN